MDEGLERSLGRAHLLTFGIGGLIGAGIFTLSGYIIQNVGWWGLATFLLASLFSAASCLVYAEFAASHPTSGGGYSFIKLSASDNPAFLGGWLFFVAYTAGSAFYAVAFARYAYLFLGVDYVISVVGVSATFLLINLLGARESGNTEYLLVATKVVILLSFSLSVMALLPIPQIEVEAPNIEVLTLTTVVFIAFEGYDIIATAGEEAKHPEKDLPWSIVMTLVLGTAIYLMVVFSMLLVSYYNPRILTTKNHEEIIVLLAGRILGSLGSFAMLFGVFISTLSAYNASFYAASRVVYRMSKDGLLPSKLSRTSKRRVPESAIFLAFAITLSLIFSMLAMVSCGLLADHEVTVRLGELSSMSFALAFAMVDASLILDRRKRRGANRPFKAPLYPLTPLVGVAFALYSLIETALGSPESFAVFIMVLGLGILLRIMAMMAGQGQHN